VLFFIFLRFSKVIHFCLLLKRTVFGGAYKQRGGRLGRPEGTSENEKVFLNKDLTQKIIKNLKKGLTIRDVSKIVDCSNKTIIKTKKLSIKHGLLKTEDLKRNKITEEV